MKQIGLLLLLLIAGTSYSQPATTDPYFLETRDTVSVRGPLCITRNILEDKKGNIWIASWQGIMMYDGKTFTNYTLKNNLIHFHVFSIMEDRGGNIWFGTIRGGAYKYDGKTFTLFTSNDGLADDQIGCFMEDKAGNVWIGTEAGVSRLDPAALNTASVKANMVTLSGLPLTSKKGFTTYNTHNGLCGDRVNSMIEDKSGIIWIATRSGVSCYDGKSFTDFKIEQGRPFTNVRCIKEDKSGKIWIGGQEGLYCYDRSATGEARLSKLESKFICSVYEDHVGNIWFSAIEEKDMALYKGMALYKYDGKSVVKIIEKNKEADMQIFEITEDRKGNIWFSTMRGCCRYDGKTFAYFTS